MLTPWCLLPTRWVLCLHSAGRRRDALHSLRPMPRLLAATTVLGALAWASTTARAAPWAPKKKAARDLINAAADAADAGDFARSAALSLDSLKVEPSIIAAWNAGEAFTAAGEWLRAIEQYDRALADPHLPKKRRPDIEARRDLARAFLDASTAADAQRWDEARAAYLAILDRDDLVPQDKQNAGTAIDQLAQRRAAAEAAAAAAAHHAQPEEYTAHTAHSTRPAPRRRHQPPSPHRSTFARRRGRRGGRIRPRSPSSAPARSASALASGSARTPRTSTTRPTRPRRPNRARRCTTAPIASARAQR
jgi:hypothetical protein